MAHGVQEAEVLRRADEVAEPGERAPGVGEGEADGVSGRQDAERDQQEQVGGDEGDAGPALPADAAGAPVGETMDLPWVSPGLTVAAQIASWLNCPEPQSGQTWDEAAASAPIPLREHPRSRQMNASPTVRTSRRGRR
jgi:hypothetical protein